jgi:hypothetical protein
LYRFCWFFFFIKKFSDAIFAHNIQWIFISLQSFFSVRFPSFRGNFMPGIAIQFHSVRCMMLMDAYQAM